MKGYLIHLICETASYYPFGMFAFGTFFVALVCYNAFGWVGIRNMAIVYVLAFVLAMLCVGAVEFCIWFFRR